MSNEQLALLIRAGDEVTQNMAILYEQNKRLIYSVAKRYQGYEEIEDLMQEGYFGLCAAVDHWDPEAGSFITCAVLWIRQRMQRYVWSKGGIIRIPEYMRAALLKRQKYLDSYKKEHGREPSETQIKTFLGLNDKEYRLLIESESMAQIGSLDKPLTDDQEDTAGDMVPCSGDMEEDYITRAMQEDVRAAVDDLDEKQAEAIRGRWFEGESYDEIGQNMEITREQARQLELKAFNELRKSSRVRKLREYIMETDVYRGTGLQTFRRTHTSSVEKAVIRIEERY